MKKTTDRSHRFWKTRMRRMMTMKKITSLMRKRR